MTWPVTMVERQKLAPDISRAAMWSTMLCPHNSCRAWEASKHLRLMILIFILFVLSENLGQSCCMNETGPTSDCSFHSPSRGQHVACTMKDYRRHIDGCYHEYWTNNNDEIPGRVTDLDVSYYYTQCDRSLNEEPNQTSERCPKSCSANNGMAYIAINITFKLDYTSASKVTALEIKLIGLSGGFHGGKTWCVLYEYGKGNVTYNDAKHHIFYYDGFIGLVPGYEYEVGVRSLPTARVDESTWNKYKLKARPCWKPVFRIWPPTLFAVNFTLILNSQDDYKDMIDEYYIAVSSSKNSSSTHAEQIVKNTHDEKQVLFRCLEPGTYNIEIQARGDCESCLPYLQTHIVQGGKPPISGCPANITLYTEIGGNVSATWLAPSATSSCPNLAPIKTNQSHHSGDFFLEPSVTEVRYEFWQYDQDDKAKCSFYVHILSDLDPPVVTCSNLTLPPESPNSFNGLVEGESYTYFDANPDFHSITYNITQGHSGDLFPPGVTPVALVARDAFHNNATCIFYVENGLTELPVNCPSLDDIVSTDPGKETFTFHPNFEEENVTKSIPGYIFHGDVSVHITIGGSTVGSSVPIGNHEVVAVIYDDVLSKTCRGLYIVKERHRQNTSGPVAVIVGSVLGLSLAILIALFAISNYCPKEPGKSRFETCKQKLKKLTETTNPIDKTEGVEYSPARDQGIELRYLVNAPNASEYSSAPNINEKVMKWECDPDSGLESPETEDMIYSSQTQIHECEIHASSTESPPDTPNTEFFDSGNVDYSHNKSSHNSEDGNDYFEGRQKTCGGTLTPILDRRNQPQINCFDAGTGLYYPCEHLRLYSDMSEDSDGDSEHRHRKEAVTGNRQPLLNHGDIPLADSDVLS